VRWFCGSISDERDELRAEVERLRGVLGRIAATTPKMNLGREMVDVPVLDMWDAQKVASAALNASCECPSPRRHYPDHVHDAR
jgi:hypothetical protein